MAEIASREHPGRIVVGVDGSDPSKEALLWASQEAELSGALLEVVWVWEMPITAQGRVMQVPGELDYAVEAEHKLQETIRGVLGDSYDSQSRWPSTRLKTVVLEGRPGSTLLEVAKGADMLVVGHSRHRAAVGMLLGSVSEHCIGQASCPVVVVHSWKRAA